MPKKVVRKSLLQQRRQLTPQAVEALGHRAQMRLLELGVFRRARVIALYSPIQNEVATHHLAHAAWRHGQTVLYPRVNGRVLELVPVESPGRLRPGAYGIFEPEGDAWPGEAAVDLLVAPGVAFDRGGSRLGYGQGYYDRLLALRRRPEVLVGLCYDFQLLEALPTDAHDIPMDLVVTDSEMVDARRLRTEPRPCAVP